VAFDALKAGLIVFVAAILQVSVFSSVTIVGGTPDVLFVALVCVALLRGSIAGSACGFLGGLLLDTATLGTLGFTSLLYTVVGYWVGRYGETTGRDRAHAPFLAVAVVTVLYAIGALALHFVLGEPAPARAVLVDALFQDLALNLLVTIPAYALTRRVLKPSERTKRFEGMRAFG
jgi:rod shape-determining protein MreD